MHSISHSQYLASCCQIAVRAGEIIMPYFQKEHGARQKADHSPVTDADVAANTLITEALLQLAPQIPVIAEEDKNPLSEGHELFWLVDPLDGTRSFVRGEPEFTVNIGLIQHGKPVLGVIYAPPQQMLYFGEVGGKAMRTHAGEEARMIQARPRPEEGITVVKSKSHPSAATTEYLSQYNVKELVPGSSSIKFCTVAEGNADLYPRFGRTMEWDTAAGHAILLAAGGRVETIDGQALSYGKPGYENPAFIGFGR